MEILKSFIQNRKPPLIYAAVIALIGLFTGYLFIYLFVLRFALIYTKILQIYKWKSV